MNCESIFFNLQEGKSNFKKSRDEILDIREKKFREILKYAYSKSNFYNKLYSSYGISEENIKNISITQLPSIDKKILIDNFDDLVTVPDIKKDLIEKFAVKNENLNDKYLDKYNIVHSSGSVGIPTYFVYDENAWEYMLSSAIRASLFDLTTDEIISHTSKGLRIAYIAATQGRYGGVMAASSCIKGLNSSQLLLNVNLPLEQWIDELIAFKPNVIVGYPSALKILCQLIESRKVNVDVFKVISCGEPLIKSLREYIEKYLDTDIVNIYGASESLILGMETRNSDGIYFFDDVNYLEVIDDSTYITSLYNFAQPLIRYKLSDELILKKLTSNELLPYTKIESILGRDEDIMWFINENGIEDFLHPLVLDEICTDGLLSYQFIQHSKEKFEILAEVKDISNCSSIETDINVEMKKILSEKNLDNVDFEVGFTNCIPINPKTGKKPLIYKD
ncbi:phenylacetate--CoA ligase family protein [Clostridium sp. SHJSY1]|uniref:phenylacetate--CoA ligase family protein n=1 Tax=Clostridium sp. SHJSY1 TaxID=2942483 RepID=UPI0028769E3D|nr:phenylacetate--CoA ligase family protein [Clostridium sp. SHJSY1]MDS0527898.1 phenylacetate--CoA ligase family protein [Clostridium sp. SHJSY1]